MNRAVLLGRLVRDVDTKYYTDKEGNEQPIANFTIAVDRQGKDAGADFISCKAFGHSADFVGKYFQKGSKIALEGRITTGSYTNKDGVKIYTTDVTVDHVEFAESKSAGSGQGSNSPSNTDTGFVSVIDGIDDEQLPFA